jgi:hypothetical protein
MDERIRELVKQSGGEFWQRLENDAVNPEAYITFDPPESLEKFVELIVEEMYDFMCKATDNEWWEMIREDHPWEGHVISFERWHGLEWDILKR